MTSVQVKEADCGEHKYDFFKREFDNSKTITYKFNGVELTIDEHTPAFALAGRLHDALCKIYWLESTDKMK